MIIPINVSDTTEYVGITVKYKGSLGTNLVRVIILEGEELEKYREEADKENE